MSDPTNPQTQSPAAAAAASSPLATLGHLLGDDASQNTLRKEIEAIEAGTIPAVKVTMDHHHAFELLTFLRAKLRESSVSLGSVLPAIADGLEAHIARDCPALHQVFLRSEQLRQAKG